jgi:hypothetical protein
MLKPSRSYFVTKGPFPPIWLCDPPATPFPEPKQLAEVETRFGAKKIKLKTGHMNFLHQHAKGLPVVMVRFLGS